MRACSERFELKPLSQITEDEWDLVFRVNARGVFQATKAVLSSMKRAGGGSIVNISSGTILRGAPMLLHYVSSKGGGVRHDAFDGHGARRR